MTREEKKLYLLQNVDALLQKKPFFRGSDTSSVNDASEGQSATVTETRTARLPKVSKNIITQEKFLKELDPMSHDVLFDNNLPSICVKLENGGYQEIKFQRTSLALQEQILASHVIYLCGNPCVLSLRGGNPSEKTKKTIPLSKSIGSIGIWTVGVQRQCVHSLLPGIQDYFSTMTIKIE